MQERLSLWSGCFNSAISALPCIIAQLARIFSSERVLNGVRGAGYVLANACNRIAGRQDQKGDECECLHS
jgi:hypothetical protein